MVFADELTIAFADLRQFHPGHVLVIPRVHLNDVRDLDERTGAALMSAVAWTRTVGKAFPNEGISLWHSIGEAAFQEVQHLHIHVHPRMRSDNFLRVYPGTLPALADQALRDAYAQRLRDISDPHRVDLIFPITEHCAEALEHQFR